MVCRSRGGELDDPLHVGQEAEVEHLVRLVEHQGAYRAQVEVAALGEVEQPAGGADDDVDAGVQRVDLRLVGPAAVDGEHARAHVDRGRAQVVGDLDRQFPGGHDDQGPRRGLGPSPIRCSSGMPNARVFPVPVLACPMMSCPRRASGKASA